MPSFSRSSCVALFVALSSAGVLASSAAPALSKTTKQPNLGTRTKSTIDVDGLRFRDLNGDGKLEPYEDWRLSPEARAKDLTARMTLAEKIGTMMHSTLPGPLGALGRSAKGYDLTRTRKLIDGKHVTSFITRLTLPPAQMSEQSNAVQALAEKTRLGIPVTISTDPRSHFQYVLGANETGGEFPQWPETLGFAALRDPAVVRRFADIARQEYRAVGIQEALSSQADLATEPRWPRQTGTFGSDAALTSRMVGAYVAGFQGGDHGLQRDGVMTVVKHWVGYGASVKGLDGHNYYGRFAQFGGGKLQRHIDAFKGAFDARTSGVMPTYAILRDAEVNGCPLEQVGAGFNKQLLAGLLRHTYGFKGIVLSDWAITRNCDQACRHPTADQPQKPKDIAMPWGVESLTPQQRYIKGVRAGVDQFGGTDDVQPLIDAVKSGALSEDRIDQSVRRVLIPKFEMGLFEDPYVDPSRAQDIVGAPKFVAEAAPTQRVAQVLLQNSNNLLPLVRALKKVYLFGMNSKAAEAAGLTIVDDPAKADFAIIRAEAPSEMLHPDYFFGSRQKEGRLDFHKCDPAYDALKAASAHVPTVMAIFLDRPAILTNIRNKATAILANFGASDAAVLDVILGEAKARGKPQTLKSFWSPFARRPWHPFSAEAQCKLTALSIAGGQISVLGDKWIRAQPARNREGCRPTTCL